MDKTKLRAKLLAHRLNLSQDEVSKASEKVYGRLFKLDVFDKIKEVAVYLPVRNEIETAKIINELVARGKKVSIPFYSDSKCDYFFGQYKPGDETENGPFKVPQPKNARAIDPEKIGAVLLPAVAFDKLGHRLGYGKGVYDQLLKDADCLKIGLAYDFQVVDKLPREEHDVRVDFVITQSGQFSPPG